MLFVFAWHMQATTKYSGE